jgi:hypothetical protein
MEEGILTEDKKPKLIQKVIDTIVSPRGYKNIKANAEAFDTPARLNRERDDEAYIPDITGVINGRKSYFELSIKTDKIRQVVTKWKLLSKLATFKRGKLFLVVPPGHYAFTNRVLKKYPIEAKIIRM